MSLFLSIPLGIFIVLTVFFYGRCKSGGDVWRLSLIPVAVGINVLFWNWISGIWHNFAIGSNLISKGHMLSLSLFPFGYCALWLFAVAFAAWRKGGYFEIRSGRDENWGIIAYLNCWWWVALVISLILSAIVKFDHQAVIPIHAFIYTLCFLVGFIGGTKKEMVEYPAEDEDPDKTIEIPKGKPENEEGGDEK